MQQNSTLLGSSLKKSPSNPSVQLKGSNSEVATLFLQLYDFVRRKQHDNAREIVRNISGILQKSIDQAHEAKLMLEHERLIGIQTSLAALKLEEKNAIEIEVMK